MTAKNQLTEFLKDIKGDSFAAHCQSICDNLRKWTPRYDWVGLYWLEEDRLKLGEWSGEQATEHTNIPVAEGICGAAIREEKTIIVDDVQEDERYLACFLSTHSEIVVPVFDNSGQIIGEIDIDGKEVASYTEEDREFLEALAAHIGNLWSESK